MTKSNQQTTTHSIVTYVEGGVDDQIFVVRIYDRYHHYDNSQVIKDFLQVLESIKTKNLFTVSIETKEYDDAYEGAAYIGNLIDATFKIQLKNLGMIERLKLFRKCNKFVKESES